MGASRVGDVAHAGARRMGGYGAAALLITLALAFLLVAAYDVLSTRMHGWAAALIVAGFTLVMGGVCVECIRDALIGRAADPTDNRTR